MSGIVLRTSVSPDDTTLPSFPIVVQVAAGTSRTVNFPAEFGSLAKSVQVVNRDGANAVTAVRLNGTSATPFTVPASESEGLNNMWIEQIQLTAGAAGVVDLFCQLVRLDQLGL